MMDLLSVVALTVDLPDYGLKNGDTGAVVDVLTNDAGYVVEFVTILGRTVAIVEVVADQIRPVMRDEIANARHVVSVV